MKRPGWREVFADRDLRDALFAAARECHAEADDCDPQLCAHPEMLMMPIGLPEWIETEILKEQRRPVRLDHHENRSVGQHVRRALEIVAAS